jgi:phosphohistidine phosphatase SixA
MKIILVRHGEKARVHREDISPLSATGEGQVRKLGGLLEKAGEKPTLFLTSRFRHAQQTAELLWCALNPLAPLVHLESLTPLPADLASPAVNAEQYVAAIFDEVRELATVQPRIDLGSDATIVMVLHQPRHIQVALQLQGESPRGWKDWRGGPLSGKWPYYAEAVYVTARDMHDIASGRAMESPC